MTQLEHHPQQPLLDHLTELRRRLIYVLLVFMATFIVSYIFKGEIFQFFIEPLAQQLQNKAALSNTAFERRMIFTNMTEGFLAYVKVAALAASFVTAPFATIQLWLFISPALYARERLFFLGAMATTPLLFILGASFAYKLVLPKACEFFLSFENTANPLPIVLEAKINEYLSFVVRLILCFGLCFEMPIFLALLAGAGILSPAQLIKKWRVAVLVIFVVAAFVTPPDIISMLALALPLVMLYGISIVTVKLVSKKSYRND